MAGMNAPPEETWIDWNNRLQEDSDRPFRTKLEHKEIRGLMAGNHEVKKAIWITVVKPEKKPKMTGRRFLNLRPVRGRPEQI
jgi:hypothetical protein